MIKKIIKHFVKLLGYNILPLEEVEGSLPPDFTEEESKIIKKVKAYTMTSPERLYGLINAVKHIEQNSIEGSIVECGVWKGGSMMAVAYTLLQLGNPNRELYLFDTFEGMPVPTKLDLSIGGRAAIDSFNAVKTSDDSSDWCKETIEEVVKNLRATNYDEMRVHFIKGKVEETIPGEIPEKIALLRLDTDWYESTKHELDHLYPRLQDNGVIIIDDYGHWQGARKAVDEYFESNGIKILLNRMDYTGRMGIKF